MITNILKMGAQVPQRFRTLGLSHVLDNPNAYGTAASDQFGYSIAASGDYVVVGVPFEYDVGGTSSGKVYVFNVNTGALLYTLHNPNAYGTSAGDQFGVSVDVCGDYLVAGAHLEDEVGNTSSGKVYVFNIHTGALLHVLNNPNAYGTPSTDYFGFSVAASDNYVVVGAYLEDDAGGASSGKAYIFSIHTGALLHVLHNPNAYGTSSDDRFGLSVSAAGDYVVAGAHLEDNISYTNVGAVYVFRASTGALLHTLHNPNAYGTPRDDYFGFSVAASDNYVVVGAYLEDDAGGTSSGKAYIFSIHTGALLHVLHNPNAYGTTRDDYFGFSVAASGDYVVVGAYLEDEVSRSSSGKAYVFNAVTGVLLHTLNNPNTYGTAASDQFGRAVAISDGHVVVGVPFEDDVGGTSSGKVYIFS